MRKEGWDMCVVVSVVDPKNRKKRRRAQSVLRTSGDPKNSHTN